MYDHINSDVDQRQPVEILVLDISPIKPKYVSQNTIHYISSVIVSNVNWYH